MACDSRLHRLDPTFKLLVFCAVLVSVLASSDWRQLGLVAVYVGVLCLVSGVRLLFYLESLKYFMWMFALSFAVNAIFPRGGQVTALSLAALEIAGIFSVRLALMIVAATLLTVVMAPSEIGDTVLRFGGAKGAIGRRAAEFAAVLSISLRFVPVMFEEAERIKSVQILRGRSTRGLRGKIALVVGLVAPLVDASLRRASSLGFALQARCYGYRVPKSPHLRLGADEVIFGCSGVVVVAMTLAMR